MTKSNTGNSKRDAFGKRIRHKSAEPVKHTRTNSNSHYSLPLEGLTTREAKRVSAEHATLDYVLNKHYPGTEEVPEVPEVAYTVLCYLFETDAGSITVTGLREILFEGDVREKAEFSPEARDWLARKVTQAAINLKIPYGELLPVGTFLLRYAQLCKVLGANIDTASLYCEAAAGNGEVRKGDNPLVQQTVSEIYG